MKTATRILIKIYVQLTMNLLVSNEMHGRSLKALFFCVLDSNTALSPWLC